jgi:hypothetical protein
MKRVSYVLCAAALTCFAILPGCDDGASGVNPPPTNLPPVAEDDIVTATAGTPVSFDVTANDTDANGDTLTIETLTPPDPSEATIVEESDGTLTITANPAFTGVAAFSYTVSDPSGLTDEAEVALVVGVTFSFTIDEVRGLFKPNTVGVGEYQAGYASADGLGRVYSNHVYAPGDPSTTVWTKNAQYVDITFTVSPASFSWPSGARLVWTATDVDDPSNEDPLTHPQAGPLLDPNDYDGIDNDHNGTGDVSDGMDNTGSRDGATEWEEIDAGWTLTGGEMVITGGAGSVRFNATDDGGDNFAITAGIKLTAEGPPVASDAVGTFTVWKRVDVEYVQMATATGLDGLTDGQANDAYAMCFVELATQAAAPRVVTNLATMGVNMYDAGNACDKYVTAADGEFTMEGEDGWYFAAAANKFVDDGAGDPATVYHQMVQVDRDGTTLWLNDLHPTTPEIPASLDDRYAFGDKTGDLASPGPGYQVMQTDFEFPDATYFEGGMVMWGWNGITQTYQGSAPIISHTQGDAMTGAQIEYGSDAPAPLTVDLTVTREMISSVIVYTPDPVEVTKLAMFQFHNFSYDPDYDEFAVWSKGYSTPTVYNYRSFNVIDHGFPALSVPTAFVQGMGSLTISGISPGPHGGLEGRTIVFTDGGDGGGLATLTHEFGHALGFQHICGNWNYRSHGSGGACTMHYASWYLMLNDANPRKPALWVYGDTTPYFCEEHIIEIRKQNLEDLAILGWGS